MSELEKLPPPTRSHPNGHPADGMVIHVDVGDGAQMDIIDPRSFENGGLEWVLRYGNAESVRYTAAMVLSGYDYLLSDDLTMKEATARLRRARFVRKLAVTALRARAAHIQEPKP